MAKKQEVTIPRILIGVPILSCSYEFLESFLTFWTSVMVFKHKGKKFHIGYKFVHRVPVHKAEEQLAELAVATGCTHLLLMDDDIFDVTADDLIKLLEADKDVVGGIMYASGFPYAMCAFRRFDVKQKVADQPILKGPARLYEVPPEQRKGIQKVDLIPFGFTLIKTKVFEGLKKPWFNSDTQAPTDSWFADRVLSKKFDYFAHFDVWLNHRRVTRETQPLWVQLGLIEQKKMQGRMVELSPDQMRTHEMFMQMKLTEAEKKQRDFATGKVKFMEKTKKKAIARPVKS